MDYSPVIELYNRETDVYEQVPIKGNTTGFHHRSKDFRKSFKIYEEELDRTHAYGDYNPDDFKAFDTSGEEIIFKDAQDEFEYWNDQIMFSVDTLYSKEPYFKQELRKAGIRPGTEKFEQYIADKEAELMMPYYYHLQKKYGFLEQKASPTNFQY